MYDSLQNICCTVGVRLCRIRLCVGSGKFDLFETSIISIFVIFKGLIEMFL